ncbi:MAG: choice-of-anchor Q domain-containing protein, partial [Planctomycetia bacterium]
IDGGGAITLDGDNASRILSVSGGIGLVLDGLTFTRGDAIAGTGGAVSYSGLSFAVVDSIFDDNDASSAGALTISQSAGGTVSIVRSQFSDNTATSFGAINIIQGNDSSLEIVDSEFMLNSATTSSGAVSVIQSNRGTVTLSGSTFAENAAGVFSVFNLIQNTNSVFTITASTFVDNSATTTGGVLNYLANTGSTATLQNSTFVDNTSTENAVFSGTSIINVSSSLFVGNRATTTPATGVGINYTSGGNNLLDDSSTGSGFTQPTDLVDVDALLAPIGNYGGPTQTIALLPGSPAIDAGAGTAVDQRGIAVQNGTRDIGAFESRGFSLAIVGGNNQFVAPSTAFANPLVVSVTANNAIEPVIGGQVTFTAPGSGASFTPTPITATIGSDSKASSGIITANANLGGYTATASATGASDVSFTLTNTGSVTLGALAPSSVGVNTAYTGTIAVTGGQPGYALGAVTGLPAGLSASLTGSTITISGTPTALGSASISITVTDSLNQSTTQSFTLDVVQAGSLVVTTIDDIVDPLDGLNSLREAVAFAESLPGADTITFAPAVFATPQTIQLVAALPDVTAAGGPLTITGSVARVTIRGGSFGESNGGIIEVLAGADLTLDRLTLAGGQAGNGGAVFNAGTLTITGSTLSGNSANSGGAIRSSGTATITGSTLSGNTALAGGGAVFNTDTLTITGSTLSGNTAPLGGAVFNDVGTATITGSILANSGGGGTDLQNTGTITAASGFNLIETANVSGSFIVSTADPLLAPLGNYGGPTQTMALLPGSPALDLGDPTDTSTDQRGVAVQNGRRDLGAFESRGFTIAVVSGSGQSATLGTAFAAPLVVQVTAVESTEPVAGGVVTFTVPGSGATATLDTPAATIDGMGRASTTAAANTVAGSYAATAAAVGPSFALTNTAAAGVVVVQSDGTTVVVEGGAGDTLTIVLTAQPSADVVVTINLGAGLAASTTTLVFTTLDWQVPRQVAITAVDDPFVEGPRTATVSFTTVSADPSFNGLSVPPVTVSIADDVALTPPTATGPSSATIAEDAAVPLPIAVTADPSGVTTVRIAGVPAGARFSAGVDLGGGVWQLTPAQLPGLAFTPPRHWNTPKDGAITLTVTATTARAADGTTASSAPFTVLVAVSPVNDAPVVLPNGPTLSVAAGPRGSFVGRMTALRQEDPDGLPRFSGLAITRLTGRGTWQYQSRGSRTWRTISGATAARPFLLRFDARLRFTPAEGASTRSAAVRFRFWDQTKGRAQSRYTLRNGDVGGTGAFSVNQLTLRVSGSAPGRARAAAEGSTPAKLRSAKLSPALLDAAFTASVDD